MERASQRADDADRGAEISPSSWKAVRGRRKSMLLISEGISYNIYDVFNNTSAGLILQQAHDAVAAARAPTWPSTRSTRAGCPAFEEGIEASGTPSDVTPSQFSVTGSLLDSVRLSQQSLQVLANETGGFAAINRNDFAGAFDAYRAREQHVLHARLLSDQRPARRPVPPDRSAREASRPAGALATRLRGAARTGAESAGAAGRRTRSMPRSATAMNSPIPTTGIPLSVSAAAFKGTAPNATVALAVEMRADAFKFAEKNGMLLDRVEVAFSAVDAQGDGPPRPEACADLEMSADDARSSRASGASASCRKWRSRRAGTSCASAAAEEGATGRGSVFYDLEVPDFQKPAFVDERRRADVRGAAQTPTVRAKRSAGGRAAGATGDGARVRSER